MNDLYRKSYVKQVLPDGSISVTIPSNPKSTGYTIHNTDIFNMSTNGYGLESATLNEAELLVSLTNETNKLTLKDVIKKLGKEEEFGMDLNIKVEKAFNGQSCAVICNDPVELSQNRILKLLSVLKGRLMIECSPYKIKEIECCMTPQVRKNIVAASKRLRMYGKHLPVIARFDDYGNRLPDEIEIDDEKGITLKIIDPDINGELCIMLTAVIFLK